MKTLILASQSPRRLELLKLLGKRFIVKPSGVDETEHEPITSIYDYVETLAIEKVKDISKTCKNALIIGADTIIELDGNRLGKPVDFENAKFILKTLSNTTHHVITGVALLETDRDAQVIQSHHFSETTNVTFKQLDDEEIHTYVGTSLPMDKAGAYGIQDAFGARFVTAINGDYNNVVGLPVSRLYRELRIHFPIFFDMTDL